MEVGVSPTTVSYVMNQNTSHKISEATRNAILEAAKRLQYVPNSTARSLRYNSSRCIGVALGKSVTSSRFGAILQGVRDGLQEAGYWLMLFNIDIKGPIYPDYLDSVMQRRTDGILYISSTGESPDEEWRKLIIKNKLPFVACDCCPPEPELASVSFDYERGAFEIGCRLLGEGVKNILYWRPSLHTDLEHYRETGLRQAVERYPGATLKIKEFNCEDAENIFYEERQAALSNMCKQHLMQEIVPEIVSYGAEDAIVCSWTIMMKHLSSVLNTISREIRFACLSDAELPFLAEPRVLISHPEFRRGGEESARLLLQLINGEKVENNRILIAPDTPQYVEL